jgi:protein-disulfide isomerase
VGILSAALCASALGWAVFRVTALLPKRLRARALLGTADTIIDLAVPVDPERDHVRGPDRAPVTLVEYGDFECPYCGQAEPVVRELLADYGDLRYVWRHLPLTDVHPHAQLTAEAAEAAASQGKFWQMHDQLLDHQDALTAKDLIRYAGELGLDTERFTADLREHAGQAKIAADVDSADLSGVSGTPTFFINGKRHHGAYDISTLSDAVTTARTRTLISPRGQPRRTS